MFITIPPIFNWLPPNHVVSCTSTSFNNSQTGVSPADPIRKDKKDKIRWLSCAEFWQNR